MNLKKVAILPLFLLMLWCSAYSQANQPKPAALFDVFAATTYDEIRARLDLFLIAIQKSGDGARGLVVVYGNSEMRTARIRLILNHVKFRNFDPAKVEIITGGSVSEYRTDLYVIKKGDGPPVIEPEAYVVSEVLTTTKGFATAMKRFSDELSKDPQGRGYIINYGNSRQVAAREKIIQNSTDLRSLHEQRITMVRAKAIKQSTVFWVVPAGAEDPTP